MCKKYSISEWNPTDFTKENNQNQPVVCSDDREVASSWPWSCNLTTSYTKYFVIRGPFVGKMAKNGNY